MSQRTSSAASWLASPPPSVAVEITASRVVAVALNDHGGSYSIASHAMEPLAPGVATPALNAANVHDEAALTAAVRSVLGNLSVRARRVALVLPDSAAKVSLVRFEKVPARLQDLEQLIRWQMRKAAPFRIEEAQVSWQEAIALPGGGREYLVTVARRDIIESYERVCEAAGVHAGLIDIASFNQINAVLASGLVSGDWLLVNVAPDYATLAVVRDGCVAFFRNRTTGGDRRSAGSGASDRDVSRGQAGWRRFHARGPRWRFGAGSGRRRTVPAAARRAHRHAGGTDRLPAGGRNARPDHAGAGTAGHARAAGWRPVARPRRAAKAARGRVAGAGGIVLRTNLSTRPFYNERAVQLLLALAALLVVILTAFNAIRIFSLSRQNTELSSLVNRDRQEAQRLTREAQRIRAGINVEELQATADAAGVANALIDQRTFSWTEFFNRIEETLPPDVMLTAVQPSFGREATTIQMSVLGRRIEDIDEFMEKLEATGAFHDVLPTQEDTTDEGLHRLMVRSTYTGTVSEAPEAATPAQAKPEPAKPEPAKPEAKPPAGVAPAPGTSPQPSPAPGTLPAPSSPGGRTGRGGTGR